MSFKDESIWLLLGEDTLQRGKTIQNIIKDHFGKDDFERIDLDAAQGQIGQAIEEVLSFSLLSPNKIVVLDHINAVKKDEIEKLTQYIAHSRGDTPLVLLSSSKKDTSKTLLKALKSTQIVELKKTTPAQIREIIQKRLAKNNVELSKEAFSFFMEACGEDPETAVREADKLILWADQGHTITIDECRRLIFSEAEDKIWDLTDAVAANDPAKAVQNLKNLLDHGANPIQLTAVLTTQFRRLYQCKTLKQEKASNDEISKRTGLYGFALKNHQKQSARFSLEAIQYGLSLLKNADNDLKGGKPGTPESLKIMVIERLVIDLSGLHQKG